MVPFTSLLGVMEGSMSFILSVESIEKIDTLATYYSLIAPIYNSFLIDKLRVEMVQLQDIAAREAASKTVDEAKEADD